MYILRTAWILENVLKSSGLALARAIFIENRSKNVFSSSGVALARASFINISLRWSFNRVYE